MPKTQTVSSPASAPSSARACRGTTLIEVVISMTIMVIAIVGLLSALTASTRLTEANVQQALKKNIAREIQEEVRNMVWEYDADTPYTLASQDYTGFDAMVAFYSQAANQSYYFSERTRLDDSQQAGASHVVTVTLYTDENDVHAELGGPQDLNADGNLADLSSPTAGEYDLLMVPVRVRVSWQVRQETLTEDAYLMVARNQ